MAITLFPRASNANEAKEPWSSFFTGMVASLKPTAKHSNSAHQQPISRSQTESRRQSLAPSTSSSSSAAPSTRSTQNVLDGDINRKRSPTTSLASYHTRIIDEHDDLANPPTKRRKLRNSSADSTTKIRPPAKLEHEEASVPVNSVDQDSASARIDPPGSDEKKDEKRSLRSHDDGPRLKSELAIYFPFYDDIISSNDSEHIDPLNAKAVYYIKKDGSRPDTNPSPPSATSASTRAGGHPTLPRDFSGVQRIKLPLPQQKGKKGKIDDPLDDEYYLKHHKRAERREKQFRNIEKERAMHEKLQLDRLLAGLQGHDWLRVMGITGVTDSEGKKYERKRMYFIDEVGCLINKFKRWKEEEKRLKAIKESAADPRAEEDMVISQGVETEELFEDRATTRRRHKLSDLTSASTRSSKAHDKLMSPLDHIPTQLLVPEVAFTSFFAKPHLRAAALGQKRTGRSSTLAFGHPVPDVPDQDFVLPAELTTPEALRESARRRRRAKRETIMG